MDNKLTTREGSTPFPLLFGDFITMKFTQEQEKQIQHFIKSLKLTREEAEDLLLEDLEIDKMKLKDIDNDLSEEQRQAIKATKRDRSGKYEKSAEALAREQQLRDEKGNALSALMNTVNTLEITKEDKEFIFLYEGIKYRCSITRVRKQ